MYDQGNYPPQVGQSPNRLPRPQFLQQVSHPPAPGGPLYQGPHVPPHGVIPQAGQQSHVVSPGASAYHHSTPIAQSCSSNSMPGTSQSYPPQPPTGNNNIPMMHPYPIIQQGAQSAQFFSALPPPGHSRVPPAPPSLSQNFYRGPVHHPSPGMQPMITPLSASALPPPPPPMPLQSSNLPSRATFHSVAPSTSEGFHKSSAAFHQPPLPPSPPPLLPPPPSSISQSSLSLLSSQPLNSDSSVQPLCDPGSSQKLNSESVQHALTHDRNRESASNDGFGCEMDTKTVGPSALKGDMSSFQSVNIDVHTAPPRPTNEKTLRNVEILCQFISKNGPAFEDMVRQKKAGNTEFKFLFGGEPGSEAAIAHEYYLWMKNRSVLGQNQSNSLLKDKHAENRSLVEPNSLNATSRSLSDSDMDMEDDIIQPGGKFAVNDEVSGLKQDIVSAADGIEKQEEDNSLQSSQGGISTMSLGPPIKSGGDGGGMSIKSFCSVNRTEDPIRLLEGYASDGSSEDDAHLEGHEPTSTFQFQEAVIETSDGCKMQDSSESKAIDLGLSGSHMRVALCKQTKELDAGPAIKISANEVIPEPISLEKKVEKTVENNLKADASKQSHDRAKKDVWESSGAGVVSDSGKSQREHKKSAMPVKVDEFGRLMREGASETDSDDSSYYRRRGRRGRSRSSSRSPPLRKRRRKSPWRRKERRSLSRSLSPKRRRSRSRSPVRHAIDIGSNKNTRGRHQMGECFNYLKGRCYRGGSCRFLHSDPEKYSESRHYRSKQHASETRASDYSEENKVTTTKESLEYDLSSEEMHHDRVRDGEIKPYQKQHANSDHASKCAAGDKKDRVDCVDGLVHYGLLGRDGSAAVIGRNDDTTPEVSSFCLLKASDSKDVSDLFTSILENDNKSEQPVSLGKDEHVDHSQSESLKQEHGAPDNQPRHLRGSSPTSTVQISPVSSHQPSDDVLSLRKKPAEPVGQRDLLTSDSSAINYPYHVSQLPPPPPLPLQPLQPPFLHVASVPHAPQPVQYPNVLLSNQHAQYHTPQNLSWSTLPTPCPTYMVTPPIHSGPASFQQGSLPLRSDSSMQPSLRTGCTDRPIHPQVGSLQEQTYMPMQVSHQSPPHVDAVHPSNLLGQSVTGSISIRDDRYVNSISSGPFPSSSFPHGNILPRPASSLGEANSRKVQSFSNETLPSGEPSRSDIRNPPYSQQHPSYGIYQAAGDIFLEPLRYSAELQRNHPSHISDTGSIITAHHNPFASTFDQPLGSKFSSDVFRQGKRPYGSEHENSFSLVCAPCEGQKGNYGASPVIPSPNSSRAGGQTLPKSGGDQYDPLFDSIEPSTESLKKQSEQEDHAADNADIMLRLSISKLSDAKVNRRKKELGVAAAATSSENDEFGETAHAEVVAEEAGSRSNSYDDAEGAAGDVEIDQVKREGQSKKSKDSRSMKLFKVELAGFVKDMLKPSWRQGNMSKEAFKTIVKKTVEKVSGAMKGHRVPKSKEKIDQYIDRSQRKLTTLVEGYVNKYAKA